MSTIYVNISTIQGEAQTAGYEGQIECVYSSHAMDLPVVSMGASRTGGVSRHGAIHLIHTVDKASPGLRHACSAGTNLGTVRISRMQMVGGALRVVESITLDNTYIVRMELETPVDRSTRKPAEEPLETFALEYSGITWDSGFFRDGQSLGNVSGSWSATQLPATGADA